MAIKRRHGVLREDSGWTGTPGTVDLASSGQDNLHIKENYEVLLRRMIS